MALEMRSKCEKCESGLHKHSVAYICTHECMFCNECAAEANYVCPNCGGELVKRPRSENSLSCPIS
ncbi:DUF1272 domain-containing protein [Paenibacillus sp. MABNR03]|uniref:DUF1272 domain-containing protein n=1 Tax=Paenibacillus sp. MABNR03 TaxID=3142626 RepID=UPI003D274BCC